MTDTQPTAREQAESWARSTRILTFTAWGVALKGMVVLKVTDDGFHYAPWHEPTIADSASVTWAAFGNDFAIDNEAENDRNLYRYERDFQTAKEHVRGIESAVNGAGGGWDGFLAGLAGVHPTLLGKIFNGLMMVAETRDGDGRLCDINGNLADKARILGEDAKVHDIRQRFI